MDGTNRNAVAVVCTESVVIRIVGDRSGICLDPLGSDPCFTWLSTFPITNPCSALPVPTQQPTCATHRNAPTAARGAVQDGGATIRAPRGGACRAPAAGRLVHRVPLWRNGVLLFRDTHARSPPGPTRAPMSHGVAKNAPTAHGALLCGGGARSPDPAFAGAGLKSAPLELGSSSWALG